MENDKLTTEKHNFTMENDKITMEKDILQTEFKKLTIEKDKLNMENNKLNMDEDKLTMKNDGNRVIDKVNGALTGNMQKKEKETSDDPFVHEDKESFDGRKKSKERTNNEKANGALTKTVKAKHVNMGDKTSSDHGEMTAQKQAPSYSEANYLKTLEWMEASSKESFEIYSRTKRKLYDLHNKPRAKNYSKHKEIAYDFSKKKPDVYLLDTSKFRSDDIGSNTDSGENLRSDLQTSDLDDNVPRLTLLQLSKSAETGNVNEAHKAGFRNEKPIPDNVPPPPPLLSLDRSCSLPQAPLPLERSCSLPPRSLTTSESQSIPVSPPPPSIQWRPPNQRGIVTRSPIVRPKTKQSDLTDAEEQSPGTSSNQENDDDIELEVAREVFRTMIGNVRPFIPMGENEPNPDRMQLEELQTAIMDLRYLEQAMFEADEFMDLDFDEFGGFNFELPHFSEKSVEPSFARGDEVITECLICYDEVKLHKRLCCDYPACDNCMEQYIETNVTQGVVKIPCLGHESCNAFIYRDEILGRLSVPMKDKYYKFLVDANKDPKVKTCPRCSNITEITDEQSEKKTKYGLLITCSECHFDWCFECQAPWHNGIKCKEFRKGDKLVKSWAKEKHYGNTNAQKCPKCKIFIERKGGCDHMVCLKCDTGFCYKCGGRYLDMKFFGNHLSRYSPLGCKYNFKPDKPVLRKLIRGSVFGAKLLGGVVLVGLGVAAVGVLLGASVVILPAFGAYKYRRHRKFKRRQKRQQELIKNRSKNAIMELHRERPYMLDPRSLRERESLWETLVREDAIRRSSRFVGNDTVHIGIQTGKSQQVDVTVHNPYQPDALVAKDDQQQSSEIRMNITDDRGQVTVTTAEISHNSTAGDGSEAEIVLHVKTSYPKNEKEAKPQIVEKSEATLSTESHFENSDVTKSDLDTKVDVNDSSCSSKLSSTQNPSEVRPTSAQVHRRAHSTGSVRKNLKKQDFGSISRKWRLKSLSSRKTSESDSTESSTQLSLDQPESLNILENNKPPVDIDESSDPENLTQSGCFLKLLGKKINTYQIQIEKEKQLASKSDSSLGDRLNCPDVVSCALEAERKSKENLENVGQGQTNVKVGQKDTTTGVVPTETDSTAL